MNVMTLDLEKIEWPDWATSVVVKFTDRNGDDPGFCKEKRIATFPRPEIKWVPKEGEWRWVFISRTEKLLVNCDVRGNIFGEAAHDPEKEDEETANNWGYFVERGRFRLRL